MNSIIPDILVDLFCSFDQEIYPKFANLNKAEPLCFSYNRTHKLISNKQERRIPCQVI